MNFSEADILKRPKKDDGAFAELVEKYQSPVFNLCFRMLGTEVEAEDAAQETFWRAYQALHSYNKTAPSSPGFSPSQLTLCIDSQRKRKVPIIEIDEFEEFDVTDHNPQTGGNSDPPPGRGNNSEDA